MVARLDEIKDQETLLRSYAKINKKCNLILVGDGKKRVYLEGIASDLGLNIKKIFLGSKLDIPLCYLRQIFLHFLQLYQKDLV